MNEKPLINMNENVNICYDNYANGYYDEWITFSNANFFIKIHGDIVERINSAIDYGPGVRGKISIKITLEEI